MSLSSPEQLYSSSFSHLIFINQVMYSSSVLRCMQVNNKGLICASSKVIFTDTTSKVWAYFKTVKHLTTRRPIEIVCKKICSTHLLLTILCIQLLVTCSNPEKQKTKHVLNWTKNGLWSLPDTSQAVRNHVLFFFFCFLY